MSLIKRFERNQAGRDFAVGDIHGHFTRLQAALDAVGFDPAVDRLFSVGDLIDRGPECEDVIKWLNKSWFHPVRGNHDDYVCRYDTCDIGNWMQNGGVWFVGLPRLEQENYAAIFRDIPIAIEVETSAGLIGILHADCPFPSWHELQFELEGMTGQRLKLVKNTCMWSRSRIEQEDESGVADIRALIVGHTPLRKPVALGNVLHIDTMGWRPQDGGYFTLLNLETLESVPPMTAKLDWEATA
ncbi:metallophosphoesterase [Pseudomonas sp.]|uniref:metallophosphoesterase n=1 Tax=Pseudomonas sp. TaxID=306 RepID=UPI002908C44A|nr:metallophosphoesterase [Pseudomonas sp.]MDU4249036.1 metallophosphoesterase [Pseudomonas sp.]